MLAHWLLLLLPYSGCAQVDARPAVPVRLGVDDGGSYHYTVLKTIPTECPA